MGRAERVLLAVLAAALLAFPAAAQTARNFIFASDGVEAAAPLLERPDIAGVQAVHSWRSIERAQGVYDFAAIERDLAIADAAGKDFFLQLQDRFFSADARNLPDYLLNDPAYGGGLARQFDNPGESLPVAQGWVARQWDGAVRARYHALVDALAARFDGRIHGINLPETAADFDPADPPAGFSCDAYFDAAMENADHARSVFKRSLVVQYINFWPCEWNDDHRYMSRFFDFAAQRGIGLGGPDIVPDRPGQMKNSYPFFHRYRGDLSVVAMAVQEPTLTYRNPQTGRPFTREEIERFAVDYLGVDIIFWTPAAPWLGMAATR